MQVKQSGNLVSFVLASSKEEAMSKATQFNSTTHKPMIISHLGENMWRVIMVAK